ncbi:LysR family transcriptional regulator [Abyssibacter profundi]|uniref:LysR family transcriptional regulator n=1 Tax=Abyssibacter profundi TaxID=2182787 RepID=A0A363UPA0_9GAMM|nr:LysR family transcriptional regulator [Abyssibacter profundi]PWN57278.1 LysR family transcriptional regulator [Abyssibacter profundi]
MNLNHLAIFHAVARAGSVTGGAEVLGVSQSAVSRQLAEFEARQGVSLFDRRPRGVVLTAPGRVLLDYAERLFAIRAQAELALDDLRHRRLGRLAIGASRTIGAYMLPQAFAQFTRDNPGIELSLTVENTETIERQLLDGRIDIGFAEGVADDAALDYTVFAQDELVLIAAPRHPLAGAGTVQLDQLRDQLVLMHEAGSGTRAVTEQWLADRGVRLQPAMTLASTEALKQTVATGLGVALLSAQAIRMELAAGLLVRLSLDGGPFRRPLYRVLPRASTPSPALEGFLQVIDSTFRQGWP